MISERAYEKSVDLAASLAWHFSTQEAQVSFTVPGRPRTRDLHEFLAWLAVIEPGSNGAQKDAPPTDALREMNLGGTDDYNIVITARQRGSVPTPLWNSSYFVFTSDQAPPRTIPLQ